MRSPHRDRLRSSLSLAFLLLACAPGCGSRERPALVDWRADWTSTRSLIPDASAFDDGSTDPNELCHSIQAGVRAAHSSLLPSPSATLDDPVRQWIDRAEALGAECPAQRGAGALAEALGTLHALEAQIEAGLGAATSPGAG